MGWLDFIQRKILPWAPVAAILGVIAYDAFFVCSRFSAAWGCHYPSRNPVIGEPYRSSLIDHDRGCAFGVRGMPSC